MRLTTMALADIDPNLRWKLPPLILSPFAESSGPEKLVAGSRASLMLQGLIPSEELSAEELTARLLDGRYSEMMMLFYVGKDLLRWGAQSMEFAERTPPLRDRGIRAESFIALLIEDTPEPVARKLRNWGVFEYRNIFSRAVGLHAAFQEAPDPRWLAPDFLRHYHRFADHLFACSQQLHPFAGLRAINFDFDLYASGEYSKKLEQEWGASF